MHVLLRRSIVLAVAAMTLSGFIAFLAESTAAADTDTFSSSSIGTTGDTPVFGQSDLGSCPGHTTVPATDLRGTSRSISTSPQAIWLST